MNESPSCPAKVRPLLGLVYELLDAHLDTVELMGLTDEFRWRVHLDYLRALVRKGEALLAEELLAEAPATEPSAAAKAASRHGQIR